jgi:hypothetical protein
MALSTRSRQLRGLKNHSVDRFRHAMDTFGYNLVFGSCCRLADATTQIGGHDGALLPNRFVFSTAK